MFEAMEPMDAIQKAIDHPEKIVVFSIAPGVRVGMGDTFDREPGAWIEGQLVDALHRLGVDYVLDLAFSTDLRAVEMGVECLLRLRSQKDLPLFISGCPVWTQYLKKHAPAKGKCLSTVKSPGEIQGATVKTYFAEEHHLDPTRMIHVIVTSCGAEGGISTSPNDVGILLGDGVLQDNDYIMTTQELAIWLKSAGVVRSTLNSGQGWDSPLGRGSGSGIISATTGGTMEGLLRTLQQVLMGKESLPNEIAWESIRGMHCVKSAVVKIADLSIHVGVVYGLDVAERLLAGGYDGLFDIIEVMACPGGCIGGSVPEMRTLYREAAASPGQTALDNPEIAGVYKSFYGYPFSAMARQLLHGKT